MSKKKASKKPSSLSLLHKKMDQMLLQQEQLLLQQKNLEKEEKELEKKEAKETREEQKLEHIEEQELSALDQLKGLEEKIEREVKNSPLKKLTYRDFTKGMIGAFIGIVAHFSFLEGLHVGETFSMFRATFLYGTSLLIGIAFLYFAGFRTVQDKIVLKIIPLRIMVIYLSALFVIVVVLSLFGIITLHSSFEEVYKTVAAISILAILGACTADLLGKE